FVNGTARGSTTLADGSGQWLTSGLSPSLAANDSVTAYQTVNGVPSDPSSAVVVIAAPPVVTFVLPASGHQGQQNLSVSLTGAFTHWLQGTTAASFGVGVTVDSLTINSPTSATAVITID